MVSTRENEGCPIDTAEAARASTKKVTAKQRSEHAMGIYLQHERERRREGRVTLACLNAWSA